MKEYRAYFIISEAPEIVFKALTTRNTIRLWTGSEAEFDAIEGGEFALYNDTLHGQNLLIEEPTLLVQQWYLQEIDKPEDASIVSFKLFPHKKGTSILLEQSNIPDNDYNHIVTGWNEQFFADLADFYKEPVK